MSQDQATLLKILHIVETVVEGYKSFHRKTPSFCVFLMVMRNADSGKSTESSMSAHVG